MATFEGHTVRKENRKCEMPQIILLVLEVLSRNQETFVSFSVITKNTLPTGSCVAEFFLSGVFHDSTVLFSCMFFFFPMHSCPSLDHRSKKSTVLYQNYSLYSNKIKDIVFTVYFTKEIE